jgi:hypothetical protein
MDSGDAGMSEDMGVDDRGALVYRNEVLEAASLISRRIIEDQKAEIERLQAENADLKVSNVTLDKSNIEFRRLYAEVCQTIADQNIVQLERLIE